MFVLDLSKLRNNRLPVINQVLEAIDNDLISTQEIAKLVSQDNVLTAKLLKLANSEYYGMSSYVSTPQLAIATVGVLALQSLAVLTLTESLGKYPLGLSVEAQHLGQLASTIAPYFSENTTVAQSAGLLLNLGKILIAQQDNEGYIKIYHQNHSFDDIISKELERYGRTSNQITAEMLQYWKFPQIITSSICYAHNPQDKGTALSHVLFQAKETYESNGEFDVELATM